HTIRDREDLIETMADVNDADAARFQIADDAEEPADLLRRQRGARFIHDDDAGLGCESASDFHRLLMGDGQVAHKGFRIDVDVEALEEVTGPLALVSLFEKQA